MPKNGCGAYTHPSAHARGRPWLLDNISSNLEGPCGLQTDCARKSSVRTSTSLGTLDAIATGSTTSARRTLPDSICPLWPTGRQGVYGIDLSRAPYVHPPMSSCARKSGSEGEFLICNMKRKCHYRSISLMRVSHHPPGVRLKGAHGETA